MRITGRLLRCGVLAVIFLLGATPLGADALCGVARILLEIEDSARGLPAADGPAAATLADALDLRLRPVEAYVARLVRLGEDPAHSALGAELADALALAGLAARLRALIGLYREGRLAAAQAVLRDPAHHGLAGAVRDILLKGPDCGRGAAPAGAGDEGRGAQAKSGASFPGRPSPSAEPGLQPVPDSVTASGRPGRRMGLLIAGTLALALLVLAVSVRLDRREDPRYACHLPTSLRIGAQAHTAVLVEISRGGAKLQIRGAFRPGERGEIVIDGAAHKARIVWVNPNFVGLSFQRRLDLPPKELARQSPTDPAGVPAPRSAAAPATGAWQPAVLLARLRRRQR